MQLNELGDNDGAMKRGQRICRGIGSGRGKNGGRGHKGQKSRQGKRMKGFEGGQMPLERRLPKRGFSNRKFQKRYAAVNLGGIQAAIEEGRLDPNQTLDTAALQQAGVVGKAPHGVRVLGSGELKTPVKLSVAGASGAAKAQIEAVGGSIATG